MCTALWHKAVFVRGKRTEKYPEPPCFFIDKRRFYIKSIKSNQITALQTKHQKATGQTVLVWMDPIGWMGKKTQKKSDFLNIIPATSNNLCGWKDMTRVWSHCHRKTVQRRWMKTGGKLVRAQLTSVNLSCTGPCFIPAVKNGPVLQFRGQRHVQWPFVDLESLREQMCLFFILRCFFPKSAGCSRSNFTNDQSKVNFAFILFLLFYRALMLHGCSEQIYKTKLSCTSLWTQSSCVAETFTILSHVCPPSLRSLIMRVSHRCEQKPRVKFLFTS